MTHGFAFLMMEYELVMGEGGEGDRGVHCIIRNINLPNRASSALNTNYIVHSHPSDSKFWQKIMPDVKSSVN